MLTNMAEVVVRIVESAWALQTTVAANANKLSRALSAFHTPLLFIETGSSCVGPVGDWLVLYLNAGASKLLGALDSPTILTLSEQIVCNHSLNPHLHSPRALHRLNLQPARRPDQ